MPTPNSSETGRTANQNLILRWLGWSGALWVVVSAAAQFAPLVSVLGYEFACLQALLVTFVGGPRLLRRWARRPALASPEAAAGMWWDGQRELALLMSAATLPSLLNMLRVTNCDVQGGALYVAVLGFGAIPWASAVCLVVHHFGPAHRLALYLGTVVCSLACSLAWIALQPAITFYNPWVGWFAGSIYDEALHGMPVHLLFRVWSTLWSVVLVALVVLSVGRSVVWARRFWFSTLCLVGLWLFRGELGLERSRDWVRDALGGHAVTEHFDIFFDAQQTSPNELAQLIYDHEARYTELGEYLQVEPDRRLVSFVYSTPEQKGEMMGGRRTLVAKIWLGEMHILWDGPGDEMLGHELAHLFLRNEGTGPLSLATVGGLIPLMALVEGAASAAAWGGDDLDDHAWSAAMYELELGSSVASVLGPSGFWSQPSARAYTMTGSFVRWLIDTYGASDFRRSYGHGEFERVYGKSLEELESEWRLFLAGYSLDESMLEVARFRFDRPSIFGRRCARSIAARFAEANGFLARRDIDDARRCYIQIMRWDPDNVPYRLQIAERYLDAGLVDDAMELVAELPADERAGRVHRLRAAEMIADARWLAGDHRAAEAAYLDQRGQSVLAADRRRLHLKQLSAGRCMQDPETCLVWQRALVSRPGTALAAQVAELLPLAMAQDPAAIWLVALRLYDTDSREFGRWMRLFLESAAPEFRVPEYRLHGLRLSAAHAWRLGDFDTACERWRELLSEATPGTGYALDAALWSGRCHRPERPTLDLDADAME
jgi:hypothetical protein